MPIRKVKGGYKWGKHGKTYKSRKGAERQAAAAHANGYVSKSLPDRIAQFVKAQKRKEKIDNKPRMPYNDSPLVNM